MHDDIAAPEDRDRQQNIDDRISQRLSRNSKEVSHTAFWRCGETNLECGGKRSATALWICSPRGTLRNPKRRRRPDKVGTLPAHSKFVARDLRKQFFSSLLPVREG
jgi:hypothetical protein